MMRKGVLFVSLVFVFSGICYGQVSKRNFRMDTEITQFITGSGFAPGTEIYLKIDSDNKRTLALGLYYDDEYRKITGLTFHHEVMLFRKYAGQCPIKPHLFYNLIYRKTTIPEVGPDMISNGELVTYTSMEHHTGLGVSLTVLERCFLDFDLGCGAYLGSIKKPVCSNPVTMEVCGSNGFGILAQVGIGYMIF